MIRNYTLISFIFVLCIPLFSCKKNSGDIGMLIASPVFESDLAFFSEKIGQNGRKVISANANYDDNLQIQQAKKLIDQNVKVLVIIPVNTNTAAAIVRMAIKHGVKTIAYERIISNCDLDYFISFDNVRIGELLANEALRLKPSGNYFVLNGDKSDRNAVWVCEGFYKALSPSINSGKIKIVYDAYIEDWSSENAVSEFKRYVNLSGNVPDVVLSAYSGMNSGLFDYFNQEKNISIPIIAGQDADNKYTRASINPKQRISLFKSNRIESEVAADIAIKLLKKESISADIKYNNGFKDVSSILIRDMKLESK